MADVMKLAVGATTVTFSPILKGLDQPHEYDRVEFIALDGTRYTTTFGSKERHIVRLNNVSKADAAQLVTWWESNKIVDFYADVPGAPATTISVRIVNEAEPQSMWFASGNWDVEREGTLILHEVSSSSSSSSNSSSSSSSNAP